MLILRVALNGGEAYRFWHLKFRITHPVSCYKFVLLKHLHGILNLLQQCSWPSYCTSNKRRITNKRWALLCWELTNQVTVFTVGCYTKWVINPLLYLPLKKMINAFYSWMEFDGSKSIKVDLHVTSTVYLHVVFAQSLCLFANNELHLRGIIQSGTCIMYWNNCPKQWNTYVQDCTLMKCTLFI